jgi:hypothetical protein
METIGSEVSRQLDRFDGGGAMPRIVRVWTDCVGAEIAANAWPARLSRDGTLLVHARSSVWAFELQQLAPAVLARLEEGLEGRSPRALRSLRFVQGHVPEPAAEQSTPAPTASLQPTPETLAEAAELTASLADPDLRERVARAVSLGLLRARSGRFF